MSHSYAQTTFKSGSTFSNGKFYAPGESPSAKKQLEDKGYYVSGTTIVIRAGGVDTPIDLRELSGRSKERRQDFIKESIKDNIVANYEAEKTTTVSDYLREREKELGVGFGESGLIKPSDLSDKQLTDFWGYSQEQVDSLRENNFSQEAYDAIGLPYFQSKTLGSEANSIVSNEEFNDTLNENLTLLEFQLLEDQFSEQVNEQIEEVLSEEIGEQLNEVLSEEIAEQLNEVLSEQIEEQLDEVLSGEITEQLDELSPVTESFDSLSEEELGAELE